MYGPFKLPGGMAEHPCKSFGSIAFCVITSPKPRVVVHNCRGVNPIFGCGLNETLHYMSESTRSTERALPHYGYD